MTGLLLVVLFMVSLACWGLTVVVRQRRRRYRTANRPRLLEECLERARTKQHDHRRRNGRSGPASGEDDLG